MSTFNYIAKDSSGREISGLIQADSESAVLKNLDEQNLFPVQINQQREKSRPFSSAKIHSRDVGVLYGQLADLLNAGVPLLRSLDTLIRAIPNRQLCDAVREVRADISEGKTLAESLSGHDKIFPTLHAAMVRAGEQAGFLEDVLENLSGFIERQDELRGKVRGALIYPVVLMVVGTIATVGLLIAFVPKFKPLFSGMRLPAPTRVVFALSDILVNHLGLLFVMLFLLAVGIRLFLKSEIGKSIFEKWKMRLPFIGRIMRMVAITRFCRILGTMLANGVDILQALLISKDSAGSDLLAEDISRATESVKKGASLSMPLKKGGLFPAEIIEMIAVAEEANQMEKVLLKIADTVERRTNRQVDQAVRLIEPLILVIIAMVIGFVAIGLVYPIFTMSDAIK